jgi:hypothetical protein
MAILDYMVWYYSTQAKPKHSPFHILSTSNEQNLRAMYDFIRDHRKEVREWLQGTSKLFWSLSQETKEEMVSSVLYDLKTELRRLGVVL